MSCFGSFVNRGMFISGASGAFIPTDLSGCVLWLRADLGITLSSTLLKSGTSPPTVTLSGTLTTNTSLTLDIPVGGTLGVAEFRYKINDGSFSSNIVTSATYAVPGTGLTLNFPNSTYSINNTYATTVNIWADLSGSGNDASQSATGSQPVYSAKSGPGAVRPGLLFDGTSDYLDVASLAPMFSGADIPFTMIASVKMPTDTVTRTLMSAGSSTVNSRYIRFNGIVSAGTKLRLLKSDDAGLVSSSTVLNSPVSDDNTWRGLQAICPGTTAKLRNNNTLSVLGAADVGTTTIDLFRIGTSAQSVNLQYLSGYIWEIIIYNRDLSDAESDQVYNYQLNIGAAT